MSLSRLSLRVLKPLPEKGTQKKIMFQRKERGMQAGRTPEEKDTARAFVTEGSGAREGGRGQ